MKTSMARAELPATARRIAAGETVNIVIYGDSISGDNPQAPAMVHVTATAAAIRKVAKEKVAPWVDVRKAMLRVTASGTRWGEFHNGFQDCHPNDRGHRVWGETVAARLLRALSSDLLICGKCHCGHRAI